MSFNRDKVKKYKEEALSMQMPRNVEAMGHVTGPDGGEMITISFAAERDIVEDLYIKLAKPDDTLLAIAGAVRQLAVGQAVVGLELIGPLEIAGLLTDGEEPDDMEFYAMLLMVMALKNALTSYADYRRANK